MSGARELDTAGITDARLRAAFLRCRTISARHGKTYYLAARLLPAERRPAVHALYGFARLVDDIVDGAPAPTTIISSTDQRMTSARAAGRDQREQHLARLRDRLARGLADGHSDHPVLAALVHTVDRYGIDHGYFEEFLTSMRMDLTLTDYPTMADLAVYMRGSAQVIGLQMLPVLGTRVPISEAEPAAAALGAAFQLTNFLRDVGEDLDRGRVYLPAATLTAHGVDRDALTRGRAEGRTPERVRAAVADLVAHTRRVYQVAAPGIAMLDPRAQPCVRTAYRLYSGILDLIERHDHDVLARRVVVPRRRRLAVALPALVQATAVGWRHTHSLTPRQATSRDGR